MPLLLSHKISHEIQSFSQQQGIGTAMIRNNYQLPRLFTTTNESTEEGLAGQSANQLSRLVVSCFLIGLRRPLTHSAAVLSRWRRFGTTVSNLRLLNVIFISFTCRNSNRHTSNTYTY